MTGVSQRICSDRLKCTLLENNLLSKPPAEASGVALRPESELLLRCARARIDSETVERFRELVCQDIDWAYLMGTALRHKMLPLVYQSLRSVCPEVVPSATLDQLRDYFHCNARRNLFLTGELIKLLNLFSDQGILAVPFKGPVLAASVYGNLSLREFLDLDILVRKCDVPTAKDLLISNGYRPYMQMTCAQETTRLRSGCEFVFVSNNGHVIVDLHWEFLERGLSFSFDLEGLWHRLEWVSLAGTKVLSLPPVDLLLLLCIHGAKHHWVRLEWICDVAELIRAHPEMDWGQVMEQAGRLGAERILLLGLLLTSDLLGVDLPQEIVRRMRTNPMAQSLAEHVRRELFSETEICLWLADSWAFFLRMRERWRDRVWYFLYFVHWRLTPTSEDQALLPLPAFLFFLYYFLRPIRLVRVYGVSPLIRFLERLRSL